MDGVVADSAVVGVRASVVFAIVAYREAFCEVFLAFGFLGAVLHPVEKPGVAVKKGAIQTLFGEHGPFGEGEGALFEFGDDGVAHV